MKKIYSLLASLFVASVCFGQSQRLVLFEEFTQASCPPCAATNPALNTLLNANSTKIVSIKYQTSWPGFDPMNQHNASEVASRVSYYGVTGVPNAEMDGNVFNNHPAYLTQTIINNRYAVISPFEITLSHLLSPNYDSIYVHAVISCTQAVSGTMYARLAVIERDVDFCTPPGTNGETFFEGVMIKMLPSVTGTVMPSSMLPGDQVTIDQAWKLPTYIYDKNQLAVVGFVQNDAGKEVFQAAYSAPQLLPNDARLLCGAVPVISCSTTSSPSISFKNLGSNTLTSLDFNYQIDAGTTQTYTWNGSLASGATGITTLPPITLTLGNHTMNVTCANPNAVTDINTYHDNASGTFAVVNGTGAALPLMEGFVNTTFPPTNWIRVNPGGVTWTRVTNAGFNSTESAKMDFFNSGAGSVDQLWAPGYDFSSSSILTAQLTFDVAYKQYSNETDRIQVMVSTDCGQTWTTVYDKAGSVLSTSPGGQTTAWTPTLASQWRHETVNMNPFIGNNNVFIRYVATSDYGNNAYVDNINVSTTVGIKENSLSSHVNVYPTPSSGIVNVDARFDLAQNVKVAVYNLVGEIVSQFEISNTVGGLFPIDLSKVADGAYTVKISTGTESVIKAINIIK
jgi:type IX secretion system substrate protein